MYPDELLKHFALFARNGRWGTCSGCPRLGNVPRGDAYPEFCEFTTRYDHNLTQISDEKPGRSLLRHYS